MPQPEHVTVMLEDLPVIEELGRLYRCVVIGTLLQNVVAGVGWMVWQTWRLGPPQDPPSRVPVIIGLAVVVIVAGIGFAVSRWGSRLAGGLGSLAPSVW